MILAQYGRVLLGLESRDDNPYFTELSQADPIDPRMAWSEGWGIFFAARALLKAQIDGFREYRDSFKKKAEAFDLEDNLPVDEVFNGILSPHAVASFLWDLADPDADDGDTVSLLLFTLWQAVAGPLEQRIFIDLSDLLEVLEQGGLVPAQEIENLRLARGITPSSLRLRGPYPIPENPGTRAVFVSSLPKSPLYDAQGRVHLGFELTSPATVNLRLNIRTRPAGGSALRTNLDLHLTDAQEQLLASSANVNGAPNGVEEIEMPLPAGFYVARIDSIQFNGTALVRNGAGGDLTLTVTP